MNQLHILGGILHIIIVWAPFMHSYNGDKESLQIIQCPAQFYLLSNNWFRYLCVNVWKGCVLLNWYIDANNPDIAYGHIGANTTHSSAVLMNNSELIAP